MTDDEAVDVIYDGLVGPGSLPVKIRAREGLDQDQLARVEAAIRQLAHTWSDRDTVPKRLAVALVDVMGGFENRFYPADEQERMEAAGMRLTELAYELLET